MTEQEEGLPTVANIWYSHGGIKAAHLVGEESMSEKFMNNSIAQVEQLVRRKDVKALIRERVNTMHHVEDNREGKRAEQANRVRHELEELLEEVENGE